MAKLDIQDDYEANTPKDVSRIQDVLVTFIVALIGTAVSLGLHLQAGFGMVPSLSVGGGLFIWLLSAHFLITRMRLKRLVQGRLSQLTTDVKKLKNELQVTELLAEGHNELLSGQDAIEKAIGTIVGRMDGYDGRLKVLQKVGKLSLDKPKREELAEQNSKLELLGHEFQNLSRQLQGFEHRYDQASQHQYSLMKAELDILEFVVQQLSVSGDHDRSLFAQKALTAIGGLRQVPQMQELVGSPLNAQSLTSNSYSSNTLASSSLVSAGLAPLSKTAEQMQLDMGSTSSGMARPTQVEPVLPLSALPGSARNLQASRPSPRPKSALPSSSMDALTSAAAFQKTQENHRVSESDNFSGLSQMQNNLEPSKLPSIMEGMQKFSDEETSASDYSLLATINDAIEANRIELFLQPIVGLPDRELFYYEAFSRLRNDLGQLILPRDFIPVAEVAELAPIIDNQIILRSIQVIQKLVEKGKGRTVFCNLSLSSLRDADFFSEFMDFIEANNWLKEYLVFEFSQKGLEKAGAQEFERMSAVAKLGFRFSLDQITRLDIDFKALADRHFGFVKINSGLLLGNMEGAKAQIHSADLDHYLTRLNITMIVDKVERESVVRQLRDYNVQYAQGNLFCEPKPVRPEVYGDGAVAAA